MDTLSPVVSPNDDGCQGFQDHILDALDCSRWEELALEERINQARLVLYEQSPPNSPSTPDREERPHVQHAVEALGNPITCMNGIDLTMTEHEHSMLENLTKQARVNPAWAICGIKGDGGCSESVSSLRRRGRGSNDHGCRSFAACIEVVRHTDVGHFCLLGGGEGAKLEQEGSVELDHPDSGAWLFKVEDVFDLVAASVEEGERA